MNQRTVKFVEFLLAGGRIKVGNYTYLLSSDSWLCTLAYNQDGDERYLKFSEAFSAFRHVASSMTVDEYDWMLDELVEASQND